MLKKLLFTAFLGLICINLSACYTSGSQNLKGKTYSDLEKEIIKGKTTEAELLKRYGKPQKEYSDAGKRHVVWHFYKSSPGADSFIPY